MMPTTLAGAQIGAMMLVIFPNVYLQSLLTAMLIALLGQTAHKGVQQTKKENDKKKKDEAEGKVPIMFKFSCNPVAMYKQLTAKPS